MLEVAIQKWAEERDLWLDSGFQEFLQHTGGEPGSPAVVTVLYTGGDLTRVLDEDIELNGPPFHDFIASLGFFCENQNGYTYYFYANDEVLNAAFESYFHWRWVCSLIQQDAGDVYEELYAHFAANPDHFHRLSPRAFEILLSRIFQNQGFTTELGPGSGDGGVDIRLWQRGPLGDVLTLVQAKRYAPHRKIELDAVAALRGVMAVDEAPRGIFVTTSTYLPSARRFAARAGNIIELATNANVAQWCATAANGIVKDKSLLVSRDNVRRLLHQMSLAINPRVLHTTWGYNMTHNTFALVLKETKHAALLMSLPNRTVVHDGYGQRGTEVPSFGGDALRRHCAETVWRAERTVDESGRISYWDGRHLYSAWDGMPARFDYMD
ncbi:restriction endonuclease [Delftia acidovorans]|uniref:restriction endonuclease n=1 Tax=Delftia acidovorans TaxID=80866 RepID=UPI0028E280E4|nr:restriction endonuclease [Delftia acidovorans]